MNADNHDKKRIELRYFAATRERVGRASETVETTAATLGALRDELIARGGAHAEALARGQAIRLALNHVMAADESALLEDGCEVAFFPPVTGG